MTTLRLKIMTFCLSMLLLGGFTGQALASYDIQYETLKPEVLNAYTIQLYNALDKQTAIDFMMQHHLGDKAAFYKTKYLGIIKYVVIYDTYTSQDQARAAIKTLPRSLQIWNPVVKSLKDVNHEAVV